MKEDIGSIHIVLRMPRYDRIAYRKRFDVIEEHNRIVSAEGNVLLAKFGASTTKEKIEFIRRQIQRGIPTHLYLVFKEQGIFEGYRAPLRDLFTNRKNSLGRSKAPAYYGDVDLPASLWFELAGGLMPTALKHLALISNQRPLLEVIAECRTAMMLVHESLSEPSPTIRSRQRLEVKAPEISDPGKG